MVLAREPAQDGNFQVIVRLAHAVLDDTGPSIPDPDLVELVKQRCAREHIAYGPPDARSDVVVRAVASARSQRVVGQRRSRCLAVATTRSQRRRKQR